MPTPSARMSRVPPRSNLPAPLPRKRAPAARRLRTTAASSRAMLWAHRLDPAAVGQSALLVPIALLVRSVFDQHLARGKTDGIVGAGLLIANEAVDPGIGHLYDQFVAAGLQRGRDIDAIGRMPDDPHRFAVDCDLSEVLHVA